MRIQTEQTDNKSGVFFYLLFLTGFFLLLEISFFIQSNQAYLSDYTFISDKLPIPAAILPGIGFFIVAQLLIHVGYCLLVFLITFSLMRLFHFPKSQEIQLGISVWLLGILTVLVANLYYFPNSRFSDLLSIFLLNDYAIKGLLYFLFACCFTLLIVTAFSMVYFVFAYNKAIFLMLTIAMAMFLFALQSKVNPPVNLNQPTTTYPNIILIGVDSLRPDFLGFFGHDNRTPFFDAFLSQATVFNEAVTPLARTFPSWTCILTGQYPKQNGVRFNLAQQDQLDFSQSLPTLLKQAGYETIFATDETRFSNVDKKFGFDQVITPPMGMNDFLLGSFNDFPFSNLLINTSVGKWLFPYSYANRPVFFTYDPDSFLKLMQPTLSMPRTKPLFLTVHFCLTHYPYTWAGLPANKMNTWERYAASIERVDQQLADFYSLLSRYHLLDHAIVVLLSDHGETLELNGDRLTEKELFKSHANGALPKFYPPSLDKEEVNQSAGHGTDVLGLTQYHTLLAFRLYTMGQQPKETISGVVSVLDIKPTILELIGKSAPTKSDSQSLAALLEGKQFVLKPRHIFLESDYTPEAIRTVYPETRKVLLEGIALFKVAPDSTRLVVKEQMGRMIIRSKQYADIYGEWMLALYPFDKTSRTAILLNLVSGEWTDNLQSPWAQNAPVSSMLMALKSFYGAEINKINTPSD